MICCRFCHDEAIENEEICEDCKKELKERIANEYQKH
jgi:hypothetical protein